MTKVKLRCGTVELLDINTILMTYRNDHHITLEDVMEIDSAVDTLIPDGDFYSVLTLQRSFLDISSEAQKMMAHTSPLVPRLKGAAVILNNLPSRLIIGFFIKRFKPIYPTKIVKNMSEAQIWIQSQKSLN